MSRRTWWRPDGRHRRELTRNAIVSANIDARIKIAEEGLKPSPERLKETVSHKVEKLGPASPTKRRNYLECFRGDGPDPVELGLEAAEAQA
jgi:type IV secretion system protein VirD4